MVKIVELQLTPDDPLFQQPLTVSPVAFRPSANVPPIGPEPPSVNPDRTVTLTDWSHHAGNDEHDPAPSSTMR